MDSGGQYSIDSICRICLEHLRNDNSYDLFRVPGLSKKLWFYTSLTVDQQDGFPKNICDACCTRLNDLADFLKLCVDSVQKFQDMVAANTFSTGPINFDILDASVPLEGEGQNIAPDEDEPLSSDPLLNHNEVDVFKMLDNCNKETELNEQQFIQEKIKNEEKQITIDSKTFDTKNYNSESAISESDSDNDDDFAADLDLAAAVASDVTENSDEDKPLALRLRKLPRRKIKSNNTTDDEDEGKDASTSKTDKPKRKRIPAGERHIIECHICHKKFKKNERYQEHIKYHNEKLPHQCTVETCLKGFTSANRLRLHVEHCHTETIDRYSCPDRGCELTFPSKRLLNWHLKKVHNELNESRCYPCTKCEKIFRCQMTLKKHMYKHDGKELPFPCNICGKRFVLNSSLKDHLMRHAGIKNFVCPYCGVGKTTRQEWTIHINTHTQEKKFKCDLCPHASLNKTNLRMHVKIVHEKIKDYACQYCGKAFGKSSACKTHEMIHTAEKRHQRIVQESDKSFACRFCERRFVKAQTVKDHEMIHTGEKPHECTQCSMRFIRIDALRRHMKVHTKHPPISQSQVLQVLQHSEQVNNRDAMEKRQAVAEAAKEQLLKMKTQRKI